jgi:hypothetical protein
MSRHLIPGLHPHGELPKDISFHTGGHILGMGCHSPRVPLEALFLDKTKSYRPGTPDSTQNVVDAIQIDPHLRYLCLLGRGEMPDLILRSLFPRPDVIHLDAGLSQDNPDNMVRQPTR